MINKSIERRLVTLERIYTPPEKWRITVEYSDGHFEVMSAEQYKTVKLTDPDMVKVIDRKITNNLDELASWLEMVNQLAALEPEEEMEI